MYRNFGLPPLYKEMTPREMFNGTSSSLLTEIQQQNPKIGGDPTIRTEYIVLPYDGRYNSIMNWEVFTGQNNPDKARNILRWNYTEEYITVEKTFYHVDRNTGKGEVQKYRKNPWRHEVYTAFGTEGSQFVPNLDDNDDLMFFSPFINAMVRVDYAGVDSIYNLKGYVYRTPVSIYRKENKQKIRLQTRGNLNPYHNYKYSNMFNMSAPYGMSYFATEPMYSVDSGEDIQYESTIIDDTGYVMTDDTSFNDHIIVEPYSGIIIRSDTSFQSNFFYDSWAPDGYKQYLMPYILYQKRADIDGVKARDLFDSIEIKDERLKVIFVVSIIIGGIIFAGGGTLLLLNL